MLVLNCIVLVVLNVLVKSEMVRLFKEESSWEF